MIEREKRKMRNMRRDEAWGTKSPRTVRDVNAAETDAGG